MADIVPPLWDQKIAALIDKAMGTLSVTGSPLDFELTVFDYPDETKLKRTFRMWMSTSTSDPKIIAAEIYKEGVGPFIVHATSMAGIGLGSVILDKYVPKEKTSWIPWAVGGVTLLGAGIAGIAFTKRRR